MYGIGESLALGFLSAIVALIIGAVFQQFVAHVSDMAVLAVAVVCGVASFWFAKTRV